MFKKLLQASILLTASALSVNAYSAVISGSVNLSDSPTSTNLWDLYYSIVIPQFDDLGGTRSLISVELSFEGSSKGTLTFTNDSTTTASYEAQVSSEVSVANGNTGDLAEEFFYLEAGGTGSRNETYESGTLAANGGQANVAVPASDLTISDSLSIDASTDPDDVGGLLLSNFVGTGDITAFLSSVVLVAATTSSDFTVSGAFTTSGVMDYTYNYTTSSVSVSEPAGVAFLGLALGMMGLTRRRRQSN